MESIYDTPIDPLSPNNAHGIAIQLVGRNKKVLELGAAGGHVTRVLVERGNQVTAIERDGRLEDKLRTVAHNAYITDLDWLDLRELVKYEKYDVIVAGDVLEHCRFPELIMAQFHDLLNPNGYIVISLPNIAHADVRLALLTGRFEYSNTGLLDRTHLRFFTRETIEEMVSNYGFEINQVMTATVPIGATELGSPDTNIPIEAIDFIEQDRDATVYQYVFSATPIDGWLNANSTYSRVHHMNDDRTIMLKAIAEFQELTERLVSKDGSQPRRTKQTIQLLEDEIHRLQHEIAEVRTSAMNSRDYIIGLAAQRGELEHQLKEVTQERDRARKRVKEFRTSSTWKVGRLVLLPVRILRRLIRW